MKTFKEYILEKLKVTKFSGTGIPTYQEYYDLLDEYCKTFHRSRLDLSHVVGFNEPLPRYKGIEHKSISAIKPIYSSYPEIRVIVYDSSARNSFTYIINVKLHKDVTAKLTVKVVEK